ncbi:hypothetical protein KR100_14500 [Synechococcus sp. KORDI-100]|nr:hypothetical protein KR100_14500 [Synechococcus sp. KORDI-100]
MHLEVVRLFECDSHPALVPAAVAAQALIRGELQQEPTR